MASDKRQGDPLDLPPSRRPRIERSDADATEASTSTSSPTDESNVSVPSTSGIPKDSPSMPGPSGGDGFSSKTGTPHTFRVRQRYEAMTLSTKPNVPTTYGTEGLGAKKVNLTANYFELEKCKTWILFHFHVDFEPEEDRTWFKKLLMRSHKDIFKEYIFDGASLFTVQNICKEDKPLVLKSMKNNGEEVQITVKFVGICEGRDYQYLQVFNIIMREALASLKLQLIRRKYFDPGAKIQVPEHRLELWPGYDTTMTQCQEATLLRVELSFKVLRSDTALDVLKQIHKDSQGTDFKSAATSTLVGQIIMTKYNNRTYRIEDISFGKSPSNSSFRKKKSEEEITFLQYYSQKYNLVIRDPNQPLLVVKCRESDKRAVDGKEMVMLIPELCHMTGLTDEMRNNFQLMRAMAEHTSVDPTTRIKRLMAFNSRMNIPEIKTKLENWGLKLKPNLVNIPGRILPGEIIMFKSGKTAPMEKPDWTRDLQHNTMGNCSQMSNWVFICPNNLTNDAQNFLQTLREVGKGLGLAIVEPSLRKALANDSAGEYVRIIENVVNTKNPQLLICIVSNNRADRYNAIKKKCILEKGVPSQVVTGKTLRNRGLMSIATKIAIQINTKLGGVPWGLQIPLKGLMAVGIDILRDPENKQKKYVAMVSSLDYNVTKYFSNVSHCEPGAKMTESFTGNIERCLQRYYRKNGNCLPNYIVLYRAGVSEGELSMVYEQEVKMLKERLQKIYAERGGGIALKFVFLVVNKKLNCRIFAGNQNPLPGTVVDRVITSPLRYEFYLISQSARNGTVSPTHYNVMEDTTGLQPDHIQRLTYKFTHLYYNWSGTVSVPAPCQYAQKLAHLTCNSLRSTHKNMDELLYFL